MREARSSRDALLAVANSYFDGLTTHDGTIIMHEPGCTRIEKGTMMTGRGGRGPAPARGAAPESRGPHPTLFEVARQTRMLKPGFSRKR